MAGQMLLFWLMFYAFHNIFSDIWIVKEEQQE